jgi:hypothetical protein
MDDQMWCPRCGEHGCDCYPTPFQRVEAMREMLVTERHKTLRLEAMINEAQGRVDNLARRIRQDHDARCWEDEISRLLKGLGVTA